MASYEAWNLAISAYFTAGSAQGSPIFLSLDEDALDDLANNFLNEKVDDPQKDYILSVKDYCFLKTESKIDIATLQKNINGIPNCVAFLGAMVLAAYRMQDEEGVDESNYFRRLREVLGLPLVYGRPIEIPPGYEEVLWIRWNNFLKQDGFEPTAEKGTGPQTYIRYPLSQAILRESDKQYLRGKYTESRIATHMDTGQLGFWLSRQQINRKHLREGIFHADPARVWAFYNAAFRVYGEADWSEGLVHTSKTVSQKVHNIESGLYRVESLSGDVSYHIFPKQPERSRSVQLYISNESTNITEELRPLKEGFFKPLWPQNPFVEKAIQFPLTGNPHIQYLLFPKRDFWILNTEANNPQSALATWKPYRELGEKLLILCKNGPFCNEMENLRKSKLIDWTKEVQCAGWVEYYSCMVLSYEFGDYIATPESRALVDSLAPQAPASIALSGGLRDTNQNAWLVGYQPSLKVYGFEKYFQVTIMNSLQMTVFDSEVTQQAETNLPQDLAADVYEIVAKWNGRRIAARMFRIISWDDVKANPDALEIINSQYIATAGLHLRGPMILESDGGQGGITNG
jgi:hypothetical protein